MFLCCVLPQLQFCHTVNGFHYPFLCVPFTLEVNQCLLTHKDMPLGLQCKMMTDLLVVSLWRRGGGGVELAHVTSKSSKLLRVWTVATACSKCNLWAPLQTYLMGLCIFKWPSGDQCMPYNVRSCAPWDQCGRL